MYGRLANSLTCMPYGIKMALIKAKPVVLWFLQHLTHYCQNTRISCQSVSWHAASSVLFDVLEVPNEHIACSGSAWLWLVSFTCRSVDITFMSRSSRTKLHLLPYTIVTHEIISLARANMYIQDRRHIYGYFVGSFAYFAILSIRQFSTIWYASKKTCFQMSPSLETAVLIDRALVSVVLFWDTYGLAQQTRPEDEVLDLASTKPDLQVFSTKTQISKTSRYEKQIWLHMLLCQAWAKLVTDWKLCDYRWSIALTQTDV